MPKTKPKRRLLALLFSDMVGYGAISSKDERLAIELLEEYRSIVRQIYPLYGGSEISTMGDGFFIEFGSVVEAVRCGIEIQTRLYERNLVQSHSHRIRTRIGIHLGDVIDSQKDRLGDGVNIASHIESFAAPDAVCVSRQVADQLNPYSEIELKHFGSSHLKNLKFPTDLYEIVLPWKRKQNYFSRLFSKAASTLGSFRSESPKTRTEKGRNYTLYTTTLSLVLFMGFILAKTLVDANSYDLQRFGETRALASDQDRIDLRKGWDFAILGRNMQVEEIKNVSENAWRPYQRPSWQYLEELVQPFWMKTEFGSNESFSHPALALGIIPGAHRVFLNEKFIGGANHMAGNLFYSFDKSLLRKGHNTLLIQINPKPSFMPGLKSLSAGTFIGEFNEVYSRVLPNQYHHHVIQTLYLGFSFILFLACLFYFLFHSHQKKYLYFAVFLLLGSLLNFYYNGAMYSFLDYRFQRLTKLVAVIFSSVTLFSIYLHLGKKLRLEYFNNIFALFWMGSLFIFLVAAKPTPTEYLKQWNAHLVFAFLYTCAWIIYLINARFRYLLFDRKKPQAKFVHFRYEALVLMFGMLSLGTLLSALYIELPVFHQYTWLKPALKTMGCSSPFLFSAMILFFGLMDYISKSRKVTYENSKDGLLLSLANYTSNQKNSSPEYIQEAVLKFIGAGRSTLYMVTKQGGKETLEARSIHSDLEQKPKIKKTIKPSGGILGYVWKHKTPLLIRNINQDLRFSEHLKTRNIPKSSFKTRSCMIFPLIRKGKVLGILTVADKKNGADFCREDFSLLYLIAKDLAFFAAKSR